MALVYKDGVLSTTTNENFNGVFVPTQNTRVYRTTIENGKTTVLIGTIGDLGCAQQLSIMIHNEDRLPEFLPGTFSENFAAIAVFEDGILVEFRKDSFPGVHKNISEYVVGADSSYILGALHSGKSAVEALELAVENTTFCGGTVQYIDFETGT